MITPERIAFLRDGNHGPGIADLLDEIERLQAVLIEVRDHLWNRQDMSRCREMAQEALGKARGWPTHPRAPCWPRCNPRRLRGRRSRLVHCRPGGCTADLCAAARIYIR